MGTFGKRAKISVDKKKEKEKEKEEGNGDEEFLPEDREVGQGDGEGFLSKEVRDLMAKWVYSLRTYGRTEIAGTKRLGPKYMRRKSKKKILPRSVILPAEMCILNARADILHLTNPHSTPSTDLRVTQDIIHQPRLRRGRSQHGTPR